MTTNTVTTPERDHSPVRLRRVLVAAAALLAACPDNLEAQSHVSKLRVLAVRADPPELVLIPDAGLPATTLTALAVDPSDASVSIHFALLRGDHLHALAHPALPRDRWHRAARCGPAVGAPGPGRPPDRRICFASPSRRRSVRRRLWDRAAARPGRVAARRVLGSSRRGHLGGVDRARRGAAGSRALLGRAPGNRRRDRLDRAVCRRDPLTGGRAPLRCVHR